LPRQEPVRTRLRQPHHTPSARERSAAARGQRSTAAISGAVYHARGMAGGDTGRPTSGALRGIQVIDFGQFLAGPLVSMMLADHGAEVVRVDPPGGPRWRHPANAILQRGKRSVVLNLRHPGDRELALGLIARADVLVEN